MVDVLVKDGLQPPVDAIASDHPPVRPIVPVCARVCVQAIEEQHRIGSGEQAPQTGCEDRCRTPLAQLGHAVVGPLQPFECPPRDVPRGSCTEKRTGSAKVCWSLRLRRPSGQGPEQ